MERSRLRNIYHRSKRFSDTRAYHKQLFGKSALFSFFFGYVDKDEIVNSHSTTAEHFNTFNGITKTLDIYHWPQSAEPIFDDPVINAIAKYSDHPSIIKIKNTFAETVYKLVMSLNSKKSASGEIKGVC